MPFYSMMYFNVLDFSQNNSKNSLQKALGMNDYNRFKTEFTTRIVTKLYAGNTCKDILIRLEETVNKKKVLKDEKEMALAWNDDTSKEMRFGYLR